MRPMIRLATTMAAVAAIVTGAAGNDAFAAMSKAEKIYAELAKLPEAERTKRILEGARAEGRVVILGTGGSNGRRLAAMFQKRFPFLDAAISRMGSQQKAERFIAEERAGRHLTDALSVAVPVLGLMAKLDLIARYPTPMTKKIVAPYRGLMDSESRWIPWYQSDHGIAYNTNLIKPEDAPKTWFDLCNPKYKGKASFEPGETRLLLGLHKMFGMEKTEEFLECLGKNEPILQRGHTNRLELMLRGDHALTGDDLLWRGHRMREKNPEKAPYAAVWTAPVLSDAVAGVINRNAPHPYAAALYVDWLLSEEAQKFIIGRGRAAVTIKHPYIPDDAKVIHYGFEEREVVDKLHDMWAKYVARKK